MSKIEKTAIILVNIGTPDKPDTKSVAAFLGEFLADTRVIEGTGLRRWLWLFILKFIVLQTRPKKVAKLYKQIWQQDSPMRNILNKQVAALQKNLDDQYKVPAKVYGSMTYGAKNLTYLLDQLQGEGYQQVFVIPMFPQYSATSTGAVYDKVACFQKRAREVLDVRILKSYYNDVNFIKALTQSLESHWHRQPAADKTIFSYHGIPQQYADAGDPYQQHCLQTTELVKTEIRKGEFAAQAENITSTFQSRFGVTQWIKPYTDKYLLQLGNEKVTAVDVICPAFSADCLETLEEIAQTNKALFIESGGQQYRYIEALNDNPLFIECLFKIVQQQAGDWLGDKIES
ncbi:MAG: ferrochelatase [Oceanospirillaceae bacterium]|nr:ferrochelatase [Oceanospirillaceae bacterium]